MKERVQKMLEELFENHCYNECVVEEVQEFSNLIILECSETIPLSSGKQTGSEFTVIFKDGVFFNSNFENLEELYHQESMK